MQFRGGEIEKFIYIRMHAVAAFVKLGMLFYIIGLVGYLDEKVKDKGFARTRTLPEEKKVSAVEDNAQAREEEEEKEIARAFWENLRRGVIGFFFMLLVIKEGLWLWFDGHIHITLFGGGKENYSILMLLFWGVLTSCLVYLRGDRRKAVGTLVYGGLLSVVYIYIKAYFLTPYDKAGIILKKSWVVISYMMDIEEVKKYMLTIVVPKIHLLLTTNVEFKRLPVEEIFEKFESRVSYEGLTTQSMCDDRGLEVLNEVLREYTKKELKVSGFLSDFFNGLGSMMYNHPIITIVILVSSLILMRKSWTGEEGGLSESTNIFNSNLFTTVKWLVNNTESLSTSVDRLEESLVMYKEILVEIQKNAGTLRSLVEETIETAVVLEKVTGINSEEIGKLKGMLTKLLENKK